MKRSRHERPGFARARNRALRHARAGFTLVELMVSMIAGSFVIVGAYYMSQVSSRMFSEQLRRAETQMTLRSATEQIRRDIGRAGYLAVRDTTEMLGCDATVFPGPLSSAPEALAPGPRAFSAANVQPNPVTGDQMLSLTGNLTTSEHYFVNSALPDPMSLVLQTTNEGFRRSFVDPTTNAFMQARFLEAFLPDPGAATTRGRMVSVTDLNTVRVFLRSIRSLVTTANPPTIMLDSPLPYNAAGTGSCMNIASIVVAPVSTFRYSVEIPGTDLARVGGRTFMTGGSSGATPVLHPVLVRREIDMNTDQPIPGTERVILDSIAAVGGFRIHAIFDADPSPLVTNLTFTDTPETLINQGSIRSLIIQLIVESAERSEGTVLERRKVESARRSLRFEVMMPNAARNSGVF